MAPVPLSPVLEARLAAAAARMHRLRVLAGVSALVGSVLFSLGVLLLFDAAFEPSVAVRGVVEAVWLALNGVVAWRLVLRPWYEGVSPEDAARRIDIAFPGVGERLITIVDRHDHAHSTAHLAAIDRDTERLTRDIDFARASPPRPTVALAATAFALAVAAGIAAATVPGTGERLRRVALPWHRPATIAPFEIVVTSGDAVVRRGDPVTLAAYLRPTDPNATLPAEATVVFRDRPDAEDERRTMHGDGGAAFHFTRTGITDDFEYRIEAGPVVADWHTVRVADPVELTDQSTLEITPPAYTGLVAARTTPFGDVDGMQYSTVILRLRFTRPAMSAILEWRADGRPAVEAPESILLDLSPDRASGLARFRMTASGSLRVVLVNETGPRRLRTETRIAVRAVADAPPRLAQVAGIVARPLTVRRTERLAVELTATDDIGVGTAELEYAIGPESAKSVRVPISLTGSGSPQASGRLDFDLGGIARVGDVVRVRLRIADTRRVEAEKLGPQEAFYPAAGWCEISVADSAPPLDRQELFARRDVLRDSLAVVLKQIQEAAGETEALRADIRDESPIPLDQAVRVGVLREKTGAAAALLHDAAREADLAPHLRPIAAALRDTADHPVREAADLFRKALSDQANERREALAAAAVRLTEAVTRLQALMARNDRVAQLRLDGTRLEAIAGEQAALADRGKGSARDEVLRMQQELLARLQQVLAESESLRRGADAAAGQSAARLAAEAKALAGRVRDLDAAAGRVSADVRRSLLDRLAAQQSEFLKSAEAALVRLDTPTRLARTTIPGQDDLRRAGDFIANDKVIDALTELERIALALDKTAAEFDRIAGERADPKVAARHFARWQDDLRTRFATAVKAVAFNDLPEDQRESLRAEQAAIIRAVERLALPRDGAVAALRDAALVHLRLSGRRLAGNGVAAGESMNLAVEVLDRIAGRAPALADRLAAVRPEIERLRQDQDAIVSAVEPLLRPFEKQPPTPQLAASLAPKLAALQVRQQALVGRLAALDLPTMQARQERVRSALAAAATDLKAGTPYDIAASLAWTRRELDRLKTAAENIAAPDDRAEEVARKQWAVAEMLAALPDHPTTRQLEPIVPLQLEVLRLAGSLTAPEWPVLLNDAKEAVKEAEASFRQSAKTDVNLFRARLASAALDALADQLANRESERDRVRRYAESRFAAEAGAKKLAGKAPNPDASSREKWQLRGEVEELTHTRVGVDGQAKKKVLDLYARLIAKTDPDRQAADQKQLGEALADLAGTMAGTKELSTRPEPPAADTDPSDAFLPSRHFADALRGLAREERAVRERGAALPAEVVSRSRPAASNALAALVDRQHDLASRAAMFSERLLDEKDAAAGDAAKAAVSARLAEERLAEGDVKASRDAGKQAVSSFRAIVATADGRTPAGIAAEFAAAQEAILRSLPDDSAASFAQQQARDRALAREATELGQRLDLAAANALPGEPAGKLLAEAAGLARRAARSLDDTAGKTAAEASALRADAVKLLGDAEKKATAAAGPPTLTTAEPLALAAGAAVKDAEVAMRRAVSELGPKGDLPAAEAAMRRSAAALALAAKAIGRE